MVLMGEDALSVTAGEVVMVAEAVVTISNDSLTSCGGGGGGAVVVVEVVVDVEEDGEA